MPFQAETPGDWPAGVYQIGVTDPVLGGADGPPNVMGRHLTNRSVYQRLRNVTPWSATLAATHGYPAGACVKHGAFTWRAIVDNNVAPGTNPLMWERWGFSEAELAAWLNDLQLRVGSINSTVQTAVASGPLITIASMAAPRTGRVDIEYQYEGVGASNACAAGFVVHVNDINPRAHDEAIGTTTNLLRITGTRILKNIDVVAGQLVSLLVGVSGSNYTKSRAAINLEYRS